MIDEMVHTASKPAPMAPMHLDKVDDELERDIFVENGPP